MWWVQENDAYISNLIGSNSNKLPVCLAHHFVKQTRIIQTICHSNMGNVKELLYIYLPTLIPFKLDTCLMDLLEEKQMLKWDFRHLKKQMFKITNFFHELTIFPLLCSRPVLHHTTLISQFLWQAGYPGHQAGWILQRNWNFWVCRNLNYIFVIYFKQ